MPIALSMQLCHPTSFPSGTSPVHRLPAELLTEIFSFACVPLFEYGQPVCHRSPFDKRSSPMNFSHVGRLWRTVAICSPRLWTEIYIWDLFPRPPELLECWLKRSKQLPLTISFATVPFCPHHRKMAFPNQKDCKCNQKCPVHSHPSTNPILTHLVAHSWRWREVYFGICTYDPSPLLSLRNGTLSSLSFASFSTSQGNRELTRQRDIDNNTLHHHTFWQAAFSSLSVTSVAIYEWELAQHIKWNQLAAIAIHTTSDIDISVIAECTQLETLSVSDCGRIELPLPGSIYLSRLRHLEIAGPGHLAVFTAPAIQSIEFCPRTPDFALELQAFLDRSSARLTKLTIHCPSPFQDATFLNSSDPCQLRDLLSSNAMATLTSLALVPTSSIVLDFLAVHHGSGPCLPSLRDLKIGFPTFPQLAEIHGMISYRRHSLHVRQPLRLVQLVETLDWSDARGNPEAYGFPSVGYLDDGDCRMQLIRSRRTVMTDTIRQ